MTYEKAALLLERHDQQCRGSHIDGYIECLSVGTRKLDSGAIVPYQEWEVVPLTATALLAWLGY